MVIFHKKIFDLRGQTKRTLSNTFARSLTLILPYAGANLDLMHRTGIYEHR